MSIKNKRGFARNYNGGPIAIYSDDVQSGGHKAVPAMMNNYSVKGMNFISTFAVTPGTDITIEVGQHPVKKNAKGCLQDFSAEVIWCERLSGDSGFNVGVRFKSPVEFRDNVLINRKAGRDN